MFWKSKRKKTNLRKRGERNMCNQWKKVLKILIRCSPNKRGQESELMREWNEWDIKVLKKSVSRVKGRERNSESGVGYGISSAGGGWWKGGMMLGEGKGFIRVGLVLAPWTTDTINKPSERRDPLNINFSFNPSHSLFFSHFRSFCFHPTPSLYHSLLFRLSIPQVIKCKTSSPLPPAPSFVFFL